MAKAGSQAKKGRVAKRPMEAEPTRGGVVVVGSLNMDLVVKMETMPAPGQTVMGRELQQVPGGKGANQAAAAGKLTAAAGEKAGGVAGGAGGGVRIIARIGEDVFGQRMVESLKNLNVETSSIIKTKLSPSGVALILVDRHGENAIVVVGGANLELTSEDLLAERKAIENSTVLVLQLETPVDTVACAIALAKRAGTLVILDPAPVPEEGMPESLYHVDILTPNQTEAKILTGITVRNVDDARRAGEQILARGTATAIIKLGAGGAVIVTRDATDQIITQHIKGFKVQVVDTTAAGDCFNGALAVSLAEGKSLAEAVRFANAAGALACTKLGAQTSIPARAEVEALLNAS